MATVTVLGTGLMGSAVARNLSSSGNTVIAWNRSVEKAYSLLDAGVTVERDMARAVTTSPVIFSVVTGYDVLGGLLDQVDVAGKDLINLTTGRPRDAEELQDRVASAGGRLLDGAVICYPDHLGTDRAFLAVAGPRDAWEMHNTLLSGLGGRCQYLGEQIDLANVLDAAQLGFYIPALGAAMEAVAYGKRMGLDFGSLRPVLTHGLAVVGEFLAKREKSISEADFDVTDASASVYLAAAQGVGSAMAEVGLEGRILHAVIAHLGQACSTGRADADFSVITQVLLQNPGAASDGGAS